MNSLFKSSLRFSRLGLKQFIKPVSQVRLFASIPPPSNFNPSINNDTMDADDVPDIKTAFSDLYDALSQNSLPDNEMYEECKNEVEQLKKSLKENHIEVTYEEGNPDVEVKREFPEGTVKLNFSVIQGEDFDMGERPIDPIVLSYDCTIERKGQEYSALLSCKSTLNGDTQVERATLLTGEDSEIPSPYLLEFDTTIHEGFVGLLARCGFNVQTISDIVSLARAASGIEQIAWTEEWKNFASNGKVDKKEE